MNRPHPWPCVIAIATALVLNGCALRTTPPPPPSVHHVEGHPTDVAPPSHPRDIFDDVDVHLDRQYAWRLHTRSVK